MHNIEKQRTKTEIHKKISIPVELISMLFPQSFVEISISKKNF